MNNFYKYSLLVALTLPFSGCQKNLNLPDSIRNFDIVTPLGLSNKEAKYSESCDMSSNYRSLAKEKNDDLNSYLNLGGYAYQQRDYVTSNQYFDKAINKYKFFENKGLISTSRTLSYVTASFLNDTFLDYEGDGYEKVMMHNYKAINYLMLNDKEKARVEIMNSYKKQMEEKQKFEQEIAEYKKEEVKQAQEEQKLPLRKQRYQKSRVSIYEKLKPLFEGVSSEHMPYQNPFAYYISALVFEENGEWDDAYIDIKKAYDFYSDSDIIKQKLLYYAKKAYGESSSEYQGYAKKFAMSSNMSDKRAEIFINLASSPKKEQMKVPIYIGSAMQFTSFPTFNLDLHNKESVIVKDASGNVVAKSSILSDIDAIVVNTFKERVTGIILRQVINVGGKTAISEQISEKADSGNVFVSAAVGLGMSVVNAVTSKADTRGWDTLPSAIHALSFNRDEGQTYTAYVVNKNGSVLASQPLKFEAGKNLKNSYAILDVKSKTICK
ncbi:MAG: hypothetical protein KN64_02355 [Sulfurovum sp. AS07-7]|nr:MAG: hypothetical protein KN64_02355 [Sulfurovum sp. AS07-7]